MCLERQVEIVQMGVAPQSVMTVREMFEQLAKREGEMIQEAREKAMKRIRPGRTA